MRCQKITIFMGVPTMFVLLIKVSARERDEWAHCTSRVSVSRGWAHPACRHVQDPILLLPWICFRCGGFLSWSWC